MFHQRVDLPFADPEAPPALWAAYGELEEAARPFSGDEGELGLLVETFWAALHGLATLMRSGRLPSHDHDRRLALLLSRFTAWSAAPPQARVRARRPGGSGRPGT
jgi:hypothetical protein